MQANILVAWIAIIVALAAVGGVASIGSHDKGDHERLSSGGTA